MLKSNSWSTSLSTNFKIFIKCTQFDHQFINFIKEPQDKNYINFTFSLLFLSSHGLKTSFPESSTASFKHCTLSVSIFWYRLYKLPFSSSSSLGSCSQVQEHFVLPKCLCPDIFTFTKKLKIIQRLTGCKQDFSSYAFQISELMNGD